MQNVIRAYRNRLHLDQAELAELLGVTQQAISIWEKKNLVPSRRIPDLAKVFCVKPSTLARQLFEYESE